MESRPGSKVATGRTNSLAFAKNDCHTCKALKKKCDRQRPRCGTCLSSGRKCDGFAMPLVWKGLDVKEVSPQVGGDLEANQQRKRPIRQDAEFKFVQGRPKRRRKPKDDNCNKTSSNQRCFSVANTPSSMNASPVLSQDLPHGECPLSILPDERVEDTVLEEAVGHVWSVSGVVMDSADNMDVPWTAPYQLDSSDIPRWEDTEHISNTCSDLAILGRLEEVDRFSLDLVVLPPAILYRDLAQKYHDVLEMCKRP
jgi:hypothetical protein